LLVDKNLIAIAAKIQSFEAKSQKLFVNIYEVRFTSGVR
jgi:hypothetical protein